MINQPMKRTPREGDRVRKIGGVFLVGVSRDEIDGTVQRVYTDKAGRVLIDIAPDDDTGLQRGMPAENSEVVSVN